MFVVGVSSYLLLKKKNIQYALHSLRIGAIFGLAGILLSMYTGDGSGRRIFEIQPMKLAAAEGLIYGQTHAPLTVVGYVDTDAEKGYQGTQVKGIDVPGMLSFLAAHRTDAFVPGINDLIEGNPEHGILSAYEKWNGGTSPSKPWPNSRTWKKARWNTTWRSKSSPTRNGKRTISTISATDILPQGPAGKPKECRTAGAQRPAGLLLLPGDGRTGLPLRAAVCPGAVPVGQKRLEGKRWFFYAAIACIPLVYLCSMAGWVVAEVGRQPWIIERLMPTLAAVSDVETTSVQTTFWIFAGVFTVLLIAEIKIMIGQIKKA